MQRLFALLLLAILALTPSLACAQDDPALALLASGNFDSIRHGVEQLAASGNTRAATIIGALQASSLYVSSDMCCSSRRMTAAFPMLRPERRHRT